MKQKYDSPIVTLRQYLPQDICTESVVGTVYDQEEEYWSAFDEQN